MKVLYLYAGTRKERWHGEPSIDFPDTQLYGLNHMKEFGVDAEYKELDDLLPPRLTRIIPFRIRHLLLYWFTGAYDLVFGSPLLYMLFLQKIFRRKTKFVLLNFDLTRIFTANRKNQIKRAVLIWLLKDADAIACVATPQKKFLEEEVPLLKSQLFIIPYGVDARFYKPIYTGRKDFLLAVGRDNGRDYRTIIETARKLPNEEFHFACSRRNIPNDIEIPSNVRIFYDLPREKTDQKFKEAKILLLVTHGDDFPDGADCSGQTVLLEAMASGLPVIASRKAYLSDHMRNGKGIVEVGVYDTEGLVEAIQKLQNESVRHEQAVLARRIIDEQFSTHEMARGIAEVFSYTMERV